MENCTTKCALCFSAGLYQLNPENYHKVCNNHLNHCDSETFILCLHCKELVLITTKANNCFSHLDSTNEALQDLEIFNVNDSSNFSTSKASCRYSKNFKCLEDGILSANSSESEMKYYQSVIVKNISNYDEYHNKNSINYIEEDKKDSKCSEIGNKITKTSNITRKPIKNTNDESFYPCAKCVNCCNHKSITLGEGENLKKNDDSLREERHNDECLNRNLNYKNIKNVSPINPHRDEPNKKCHSCGNFYIDLNNLHCEHLRCLNCINTVCKECDIRKKNPNECNYCKKRFQEVKMLDCSHKVCEGCFEYNTFVLPSCKHIQCMNCYHSQVPCLKHSPLIQKLNHCYKDSNLDYSFKNYNKDEAKTCSSCSKTLEFSMENSCNHDICEKCFEEKKPCKICQDTHRCLNCNRIDYNSVKIRDCRHYLCSDCFFTSSCSECVQNNLSKTCTNCKEITKCVKRDCRHFFCEKCNEQKPQCIICQNNIKYCTNCGEKTDDEIKGRCGHFMCWACCKNKECFSCMNKIKPGRNFKKDKTLSCNECQKNVKAYIYLRCGHILCIDCFEYVKLRLKIFNFSCMDCIKNTEKYYSQICSICKIESQWFYEEKYPSLVNKICCNKIICVKCRDTVSGNTHSCLSCAIF